MAGAIQVSASTNDKITRAMSPVFKGIQKAQNFVKQAKGVAGIGDEAVEAGKAVGQNTKQLQEGKDAASSEQAPKVQGSYKKGGKVKKTGIYRLHKGERVLNRKQTKKVESKGMKAVLSGAVIPKK